MAMATHSISVRFGSGRRCDREGTNGTRRNPRHQVDNNPSRRVKATGHAPRKCAVSAWRARPGGHRHQTQPRKPSRRYCAPKAGALRRQGRQNAFPPRSPHIERPLEGSHPTSPKRRLALRREGILPSLSAARRFLHHDIPRRLAPNHGIPRRIPPPTPSRTPQRRARTTPTRHHAPPKTKPISYTAPRRFPHGNHHPHSLK